MNNEFINNDTPLTEPQNEPEKKHPYQELIHGSMPPWVMRFIKGTGRTINTFSMIHQDERLLLGVSGGKDSLALALALSIRRRWLPISYTMKAVMINWIEHPISEDSKNKLRRYFADLDMEFVILDEPMYSDSFKGDFNCYLCSRNRRRILFSLADKEGFSTIALGHHLDDMVETAMMNLFFRGDFSTMKPVQPFFDGKLEIIRPMIEQKESTIRRIAETWDVPVVKPVCPHDQTNIRSKLKPIVKDISRIDKLCRQHVFDAFGFDESDKQQIEN